MTHGDEFYEDLRAPDRPLAPLLQMIQIHKVTDEILVMDQPPNLRMLSNYGSSVLGFVKTWVISGSQNSRCSKNVGIWTPQIGGRSVGSKAKRPPFRAALRQFGAWDLSLLLIAFARASMRDKETDGAWPFLSFSLGVNFSGSQRPKHRLETADELDFS